ncbi:DEAD/DEAH box helicase [Paraburkholderia sp. SIMBA_030]|uniref:DEAD/DEAH box helicase n=1 Tax=Paraburkholderia sp. SIMBA_030 TaxID=3085773 RepID=UPI003978F3E0
MPTAKDASGRASARKPATRKTSAEPRLSRQRRPEALSVEEWQTQLRRQFGREQTFLLENLGNDPVFSEFAVTNPASGGRYRVAIRGAHPGESYCSCPDFATNDLGTCKHIEFTLGRLAAKRGGNAALKRGFQPSYSEIFLDYAGQRSVRWRSGLDCPRRLQKQAATLFEPANGWRLALQRYADLETFVAAAARLGHEVRCYDDALAFVAEIRDAKARQFVLADAYPRGADTPQLANLLKVPLYPYQIQGALFAARAGRALIGDEMGLGKTIQAIGAVELFARHFGAERILVVCPTSLKHQWQREFSRFTDRSSEVIGGLRPARQAMYRNDSFCKIANYETLARDMDLIQAWAPDVVIVDEAQRIKNWNTAAARALKRIASPYAVVLTGTPLENRLEELISIVQFVDQHRLGPTWRLLHEHQQRDDHGRVIGYKALDKVGAALSEIMLRRRKTEVLEQLPPRVDNTLFVAMTPLQRTLHDENGDIVARIVKRWRRTGYLSEADQRRLTCCLQNMRMACNSSYLLDRETDDGAKADELVTLMEDLFEQPDAKVVVFSQWVRTLELVIRRLDARGWGHVLFHGGVPGDKRGALVDRFHNDPDCRVFLSTDAGGVGLNLQHAAATVVNMDLPWNPAVLEQRIGRVHRLGQTRGVQVVNFVAQGTIEEGMLSVLAFKKSLFGGVLDGGESEIFLHGTRLSKFMESVEQVTAAVGEAEAPEEPPTSACPQDQEAPRRQEPAGGPHASGAEENDVLLLSAAPQAAAGAEHAPGALANPWAPLLDAGLKLVESLAANQSGTAGTQTPTWLETDRQSGKTYLKIPIPEPEAVQHLANALQGLLAGLRR